MFKVILSYRLNLRPSWDTCDPVFKARMTQILHLRWSSERCRMHVGRTWTEQTDSEQMNGINPQINKGHVE